jgi:hypothetical protein
VSDRVLDADGAAEHAPAAQAESRRLTTHSAWVSLAELRMGVLLTSVCLLLGSAPAASGQDSFAGVARIVAVGDVHGDFEQFVAVLRAAGVVDARRRWTGGRTHLVQTGDVLDRGPNSRKVLDLLMALEKSAARAGGRVHALLGNHEVMNMIGDLRYVSDGEYAAFRSIDSETLRDRAFDLLADPARKAEAAYRRAWDATHPLGWVEHRQAFGPNGTYGRWLRRQNAIVRINDMLFMHGGLSPALATLSLAEINARIRKELEDPERLEGGLAIDEQGPLWYRGLVELPEDDLRDHVDGLLTHHQVRHIVVGHTIRAPAIIPRLSGKVLPIDVGLSAVYGGPAAGLIVEGTRLFALHRGSKLPLDGDVAAYLAQAAALDPPPSPLLKLIEGQTPQQEPPGVTLPEPERSAPTAAPPGALHIRH